MAHKTPPVERASVSPSFPTDVHVTRWQAGDEEAFGILHRRFAPLLAMRVRRDHLWPGMRKGVQVEDVVQEVWARVVPSAKSSFSPSGHGSFLAFLGRVCERTMIDLARRSGALKRGEGEEIKSLATDLEGRVAKIPGHAPPETPTSLARVSEMQSLAKEVLKPREFAAWDLVEFQDYSALEAGLAMDCTDSAIRGLLLRARMKLVMRLEEG